MIEVKDIDGLIAQFPMYSNVSLAKDVAEKVDDAYVALIVYRDSKKDSRGMPYDEDVYFVEDSCSVKVYFSNIFYEEGKRALVFPDIDSAIQEGIDPKMFFIDLSAIGEHKLLLKLIDTYPEAKIVLISGFANYIHCFVKEMQKLRPNIELDFVLSRNPDVIKEKIKELGVRRK